MWKELRWKHLVFVLAIALLTMVAVIVTVHRYRIPHWTPLPYAVLFVAAAVRLGRKRGMPHREPTERSKALVRALETALERERIYGKQAAALKEQAPTQHALEMSMRNGRSPTLMGMGCYPDAVWANFIEEVGRLLNMPVIRSEQLSVLIKKVESISDVGSSAASRSPSVSRHGSSP